MYDLIRDSFFGQCLRLVTGSRYLRYIDELPDFVLPQAYLPYGDRGETTKPIPGDSPTGSATPRRSSSLLSEKDPEHLEEGTTTKEDDEKIDHMDQIDHRNSTKGGVTIVTWYSDNDPENPHAWSNAKKLWTGLVILLYTLAVYIGASLYTASIPAIKDIFNVGAVTVSLGLSLYVVGYGLGPLVLSPLSEIPAIGRNPPYVIGFILFVILCVPTAVVDNFAGLLVLRFLLGFFGSPSLTTGAASYSDFCNHVQLPYAIAIWGGGAAAGPAIGPVMSNFAVESEGWRWSFWILLWLSAPILVLMIFFLPETSNDLILLRRARRLRKLTGRTDLMAECEIRQKQKRPKEVLFQALIKPWEINLKDPAVLFTTVYTGLMYGIYYSFFESFPLVFGNVYGFDAGEQGLSFLAIAVGCFLAVLSWCAYFYFYADSRMAKMTEMPPPEIRLVPGLVATFFIPAGLFIFAWTSRESIHWIVPLIGVTISMIGNFVIAQCMLIYLPFTYPRYAASLFTANGLSRAMLAASAILFSIPMFDNLGVDRGVTLLAGLTCGCCVGIYILYFFGAKLRKRSKFAES